MNRDMDAAAEAGALTPSNMGDNGTQISPDKEDDVVMGAERKIFVKKAAGGGIIFWGRTQQPTGLEREDYYPVVIPKVDAVDFHDSGEEEDGDYDLIEDAVTEETYKVARDQALEFRSSGSGPRLERARARAERALSHGGGRRSRRGSGTNFAGSSLPRPDDDAAQSVSSSSSSSCGSYSGDEGSGSEGGDNGDEGREAGRGRGAEGREHAAAEGEGEEEKYWSDALSGVFTSSSSNSSSESDADPEETSSVVPTFTSSGGGIDHALSGLALTSSLGGGYRPSEGDISSSKSGKASNRREIASTDGTSNNAHSGADSSSADVAVAKQGANSATGSTSDEGKGADDNRKVPKVNLEEGRSKEDKGDRDGNDQRGDANDDKAAAAEEGDRKNDQDHNRTAGAGAGVATDAIPENMDVDEDDVRQKDPEKEEGLTKKKADGAPLVEDRELGQDDIKADSAREKGETDRMSDAGKGRTDGGKAEAGKGEKKDETVYGEDRGNDVDGASEAGGKAWQEMEDDEGEDDADEERGLGGAVALLGLRPEFMPISRGDWESAVCLGDTSESESETISRRGDGKNKGREPPAAPAIKKSASAVTLTPMSISGDEDDDADEKGKGKNENKDLKGAGVGAEAGAAAGASGRSGGGKGPGEAVSALKKNGVVGGSGEKVTKPKKKGPSAGTASMFGPLSGRKVAAFPAVEGSQWIDPPSVLNPQVDGGGWEAEVLIDDFQKVRRPKLPVCLDDPDMLFGALHTPRPQLRILQTEAQQENTHIMERTSRRKMAAEKQKRLQSAALKTGYTINTMGEGKASRVDSHIRAVIIRPPHHASPAEDKVLITPPKSWEEIATLHRPRMQLSQILPSQKSVVRLPRRPKPQGGTPGGALGARIGEVVSMPMHREKDLLPLDSRSTFVVMEYAEERPPLLGTTGMASSIITFVRSSNRRNIVGNEVNQNVDAAGFGERRELNPQEDSPFLGEIRPGSEQPAICNGLFRAPIFKHVAPDSDFLLIREPLSKKEKERLSQKQKQKDKNVKAKFFYGGDKSGGGGSGSSGGSKPPFRLSQFYVIRAMPVVFLVGQTEPQMEALEPGKPTSRATHLNIVTFLAKRLFDTTKVAQAGNAGIPFKKVLEEAKFLSLPRAKDATRSRLKEMVREIGERRDVRDDLDGPVSTDSLWAAKPDLDMQQVTAQAAKEFRPEDVCALESMVSAWARLSEVGVDSLTSHDAVAKVLVKIKKRHDTLNGQVKEARAVAATLSKQKSVVLRAARARGRPPPEHDGGLSRRLVCMEKLVEVLGAQLTELKRVRTVAQYMHKELQMVPWTLTANFIKHHGIGASQGGSMLMLSGVGDPSGCGEGFSYLTRQAEQAKATSSLTSSEKIVAARSVKKVTGTNGDLRRLTMLQLASTCEAMGIPKETVKTLRRWDRVHMIKELAGVAVAEKVKDQNIYARFVRRKRPNATMDKDLYRATCNEIWERQITALSATAEDVLDYGSERAVVKAGSNGSSRTGAKGKSGGGVSSDGNGSDKEKKKADGVEESKEDEDEEEKDDEDDGLNEDDLDMSDDDDDLNLSDMEETLEGGDGDGDTSAAKSLHDLTHASKKNRDELDDEQQYRMLQKDLHGDRGDAARWGLGEGGDSGPGGSQGKPLSVEEARKAQTDELVGKLGGRAELPAQAVRRITRIVWADGTESVKVTYSLRRQDLVRLDAKGGKKNSAAAKSGGSTSEGGVPGASPLGFFLPRPQAAAEVKTAAYFDKGAAAGQEDVVLKIRLNTKSMKATPDKKRKRTSAERAPRRRMVAEENVYAVKRQNSRLTVESRDRLPRNRMRNLLSEIMKKLAGRDDAVWFRAPVKRAMLPDYFSKIKKPMDLRTMEDRINSFEYTTREGVLSDMRQIVANAVTYNGPDSTLAQNARSILADCEVQLQDSEIEEVEAALVEEYEAPPRTKKRIGGGSGGVGGGAGSDGGGTRGKVSAKKKPSPPSKPRSLLGGGGPNTGGMGSATPGRHIAGSSTSLSSAPPPSSLALSSPSASAPSSALPTSAKPSTVPKPSASMLRPGSRGASTSPPRPRVSNVSASRRPPAASGGGGGDAGTSSDSSDGEEVVEEGGRIGF